MTGKQLDLKSTAFEAIREPQLGPKGAISSTYPKDNEGNEVVMPPNERLMRSQEPLEARIRPQHSSHILHFLFIKVNY